MKTIARKPNMKPLVVAMGTCAISPLLANSLFAQESGARTQLEEVVVTAQFREQNVQDTPISITAMSASMLDARAQVKLTDIASTAPNVTLSDSPGAMGPSISASIRGVGQYDFNPALEPGVGIYIDDVYYGALTGAQFDLLDLDRAEILRGPQGTLAGKNSIGGAVKLFSKKPAGDNSGFFNVTVGRFNRLDLRGSVDFPLTERIAVRLSGVSKENDGYIKRLDYGCVFPDSDIPAALSQDTDCVTAMEGDDNTSAVRAMIQYEFNDRVDFTLIADSSKSSRNNPAGVLISGSNTAATNAAVNGVLYDGQFNTGGTYTNYANFFNPQTTWVTPPPLQNHPVFGAFNGANVEATRFDGRESVEAKGLSFKAVVDLTDSLNLESISAYRDYYADWSTDGDNSPLALSLASNQLDYWQKSQELRLNGAALDNTINYTVGLYYFEQETRFTALQDFRYTPYPLIFSGGSPSLPAKTQAAFGNLGWDINDKLSLNLGVRYTEEEKEYEYNRETRDGNPHPVLGALDGVKGNYEGDNVDYRINGQYRFTDNVMVYASVSTGVKGGGVNPRPFNAAQALPFDQEEVTAYEIGAKTELLDGSLRLNASYFFNDYSNIQLTLSNCNDIMSASGVTLGELGLGTPCALPQNAGDAEIQGIELEAMYRLPNGIAIDATVSTLDFKYTSLNPGLGSSVPEDGITPYAPELKWNLGIAKSFTTSIGEVTPRVDISYRDEIYTNASNTEESLVDDYTVANANITWVHPDELLEATLGVTNLTDKYYYYNKYHLAGSVNAESGIPARPREWYLSIKKHF